MDPCSQGLLGAVVANCFAKKKIKEASFFGALGGIAPDLDVFIKSSNDSLLFIEYHRHFSHSLVFAPFGSLVLSFFLYIFLKKKIYFKTIYIFTTLGFFSHGLLDSFTSYGTSLLWPFFNYRVSWNIISIIDPLFTIILFFSFMLCLIYKKVIYARLGIFLSIFYLFICFTKSYQVKSYVKNLAQTKGHKIERLMIKPTFGNNILWRTIYQTKENYYVNAVFMPYIGSPKVKEGVIVPLIDKTKIFPEFFENSTQRKDILRFSYFSNDYIYLHPLYENVIADLRYGTLPHDDKSLWGIEVHPLTPDKHVNFKNLRNYTKNDLKIFWKMLDGNFENF